MSLYNRKAPSLNTTSGREKLKEEELNQILLFSSYALQGLKHFTNQTFNITKYVAPKTALLLSNLGSINYMFEGLIGTTEALSYFRKAKELNRFQHTATAWASYQLTSSTMLNTASIMTLLSATGSTHGTLALASGPMAPLVYACVLWGQAIHSYVEVIHEFNKYKNPIYQEKNLNKKLENVEFKLESLKEQLKQLDHTKNTTSFKINKINKKIEKLEKEQQAVCQHAILHARFGLKNKEPNKYIKNYLESDPKLKSLINNTTTTNGNIYEELHKNQREKITDKQINTISLTLAAVGMTLLAASIFAGPAAPALQTAGIVFAALGGAIKLGYILEKKLGNRLAEKRYCKANKINPQEARKSALAKIFEVNNERELDEIIKTMREKDQIKIASRYYREQTLNYKKTAQQAFASTSTFFKNVGKKEEVDEIELPTLKKT